MTQFPRPLLTAALLGALTCPASAQTYAAGHVTATPLPPLGTPEPRQVASALPAPNPQAETKPDAAATNVVAGTE